MSKEDIGITVSKNDDFSEWYTQVVLKAKLADYAPVKGLIVLRPDGYSIWESLKISLDEKFSKQGVRNGFLPVLIPESLLGKEQKHFAGFNLSKWIVCGTNYSCKPSTRSQTSQRGVVLAVCMHIRV